MFPIPFNFPFRKANGDISTIGAEISAGGGGSSYTLPTASASVKGGVKVGEGLTMDGEVLNATIPKATAEILGGIIVGSGLSVDENGVLSSNGGGGGGSCHLYKLTGSQYQIYEAYILTSVSGEITNKTTLTTALEHGFGIITKGYDPQMSANERPTYLVKGSSSAIIIKTLPEITSDSWYATATISNTITFTCTTIF